MQPKKVKYKKVQKGRIKGLAHRGSQIAYGTFALKALEPAWINSRQINAARIVLSRVMAKLGSIYIRTFPDKPITKKPAEVRMGKGKGSVEIYVVVIKPGRILYEIDGVPKKIAEKAMRLASHKLPIHTRMVTRRDYIED